MLVTVDIPNESVAGFRSMCNEHDIEIHEHEEVGPAGGNNRFHLAVHSASALVALGEFYWG